MNQILETEPVKFLADDGAAYLRIGAMAIAAYDYIITLPAEWRFYRSQTSWRLSPGCILFILLRYLSITTIAVSNIGYFASFSWEECQKYYMVAPILKPIQMIVCQTILGLRAYNISRRAPWVGWFLLIIFLFLSASEVFTNVFARIPIQNETQNCIGANHRNRLTVWLFYLFAMVYDVITMSISTYYLLVGVPSFYRMSSFIKLMFYDGIGYFFFLTVANVFNLILYRASNEEIQSSGATIGYVVTWIMAQRILIHLRDEAARLHSQTISVQTITRTTTHNLTSPREIAQAMRTRFTDTKNRDRLDDEFSRSTPGGASEEKSSVDDRRDSASTNSRPSKDYGDMDLDIKVQVQQSVTVDYVPNPYGRETYRTPKGFQTAPR